jgi:hypothetical protein
MFCEWHIAQQIPSELLLSGTYLLIMMSRRGLATGINLTGVQDLKFLNYQPRLCFILKKLLDSIIATTQNPIW